MRLINDRDLSDQVLEYYDRWVKAAEVTKEQLNKASDELAHAEQDFFYGQYFEKLIRLESTFSYATDPSIDEYISQIKGRDPALVLLNTNPADLKKLNNKVIATEASLHGYNSFVRLDLKLADSLILKIQKEYNPRN